MIHYLLESYIDSKSVEHRIEACGVMPLYISDKLEDVTCPTCLAAIQAQLI